MNLIINNKYVFIRAAIIIAVLMISCNAKVEKLALKDTVKIAEDIAVFHNLPIFMCVVNDSVVGFSVSPLSYCLYNYRSGQSITKISVDSAILRKSISIATHTDKKDYQGVSTLDSKTSGIAPYEINNLVMSGENTMYVFYDVCASIDEFVIFKGVKTRIKKYYKLECIGRLNTVNYKIENCFYINNRDTAFAVAKTGVCEKDGLFFMKNNGINKKRLVSVLAKANDSVYSILENRIAKDSLAEILDRNRTVQIITFNNVDENNSFTICDGFKFLDSEGKIIYLYNSKNIDEHIFSFSNRNDCILFHTLKKENKKLISSVYKYNLITKKLTVLDRYDGLRMGTFNDKDQFISVVKDNKNYYFKIYL